MPAARDESEPCVTCGGVRVRSPKGSVYCVDCNRRYREANRARNQIRDRQYYQDNKEQAQETMRLYRENNLEKIKEYERSNERKEYVKQWKNNGSTGSRHPYYQNYCGMMDRCYNPNSHKYHSHGGTGIVVCDEWKHHPQVFIDYLEKNLPPKPSPDHTIDRYPNRKGNYEPGNIRWADPIEQANNTRTNIDYRLSIPDESPLGYNNQVITIKEYSELIKMPLIVVKYRYAIHADAEYILSYDYDNRYYKYEGHDYNFRELELISGRTYSTLRWRILQGGWSVKDAVEKD
jgi:hypothetical protein